MAAIDYLKLTDEGEIEKCDKFLVHLKLLLIIYIIETCLLLLNLLSGSKDMYMNL